MEATQDIQLADISDFGDLPFSFESIDIPRKLNMMIYGLPGSGKTVLASTATLCPDMSPVLYVDVEGGALSMRDFYNKKNIVIVRPLTFDSDMEKYYAYLTSSKNKFRTVVIDTTTEVQKLSMINIMSRLYESRPDKVGSQPTLQEWGKNIDSVRKFVRYFKDIPDVNVIFIAHQKDFKDETTGEVKVKPSFSGSLPEEICGFLDIVGRVVESPKKVKDSTVFSNTIFFKSNGSYIAKDRSNRLPWMMQDPTMNNIYMMATGKGE